MAYLEGNPKTKKAAKELVASGRTRVFQPGMGTVPLDGDIEIVGPHYPKPHKWYGTVTMKDGKPVKLK